MLDGISLGGGTDLGGGAGDDPDARAVAAVNASTNAAPSEARRGLTRSFTSIGSSSFQIVARDEATRRPPGRRLRVCPRCYQIERASGMLRRHAHTSAIPDRV